MIIPRIFLVAALAYATNAGEDLILGYKLMDCLQKAMFLGIPALNYTHHNPLRIKENASWTGSIGSISSTLNLSNITWYGLPQWNVTAKQLTEDSEPRVVFDYVIHWDKFLLTSIFSLTSPAQSIIKLPSLAGDLNVTMKNTNWTGRVNYTKPGFNMKDGVNDLTVYWTVDEVSVDFSGLEPIQKIVSTTLAILLKTFLNSGALENQLGEFFKQRLNNNYFAHPEKIDTILEFCRTTPYPDNSTLLMY